MEVVIGSVAVAVIVMIVLELTGSAAVVELEVVGEAPGVVWAPPDLLSEVRVRAAAPHPSDRRGCFAWGPFTAVDGVRV